MPRTSAAELAVPRVHGEPRRLKPPPHLSDDEKALFIEIVAACSPKHFTSSDLPLLISYVQSTLLARRAITTAFEDKDALTIWEKGTKMQATLATRLRLAPQSRVDPKTLGRNLPKPLRNPWDERPPWLETKDNGA
jgi:hypothetical protein